MAGVLTSSHAACVWIPLLPLRLEEARRPDLRARPLALLDPHDGRRLWHTAPLARRAGVRPGMTIGQAIGLCPTLVLCEPDPVHYDERFARLVAALGEVSPVVEPAELGRAFVGTDGLERLYGPPEQQLAVIARTVDEWGKGEEGRGKGTASSHYPSRFPLPPSRRLGWGRGKFISWVAASRANPGTAIIIADGEGRDFLASQSITVLPLDPDTHRRLSQLGLTTLGALAALPEEAIVAQFGRAGRRLWRLAAGRIAEPVVGRPAPQQIGAAAHFPAPIADRLMLARTLERLVARALASPRRTGWRVQVVRARAALEHGASWMTEVTLKDPSADRGRIAAPLTVRLEQAPPTGAVERLAVEFLAFTPGTTELQLFARDAASAARAGRRRALRAAAQEIKTRFHRPLLHHVIEVQPWSRLPERRYALIDFEP